MTTDADVRHQERPAKNRATTSIVPLRSIAGRSLIAVVAIMTFLAALTGGGVQLIASAAADWGSEIAREVTIQIKPIEGRDLEADVAKTVEIVHQTPGVADARAYSRKETEAMLEPWLGGDLNLTDLPIPRLVVVKITPGGTPDFTSLRTRLAQTLPNAVLDDHRFWITKLAAMARGVVWGGIGVLGLMMAATALSVVFATRGAMAGNREVVEVLHFIGAHDSFIAGEFQKHFMFLGLKGGMIGGIAATATFSVIRLIAATVASTPRGDQFEALFGSFAMGWQGYGIIAGTVILVALAAGLTSRLTVLNVLRGQR